MRFFELCALALAVEGAYGYVDAQPFFMFSTSEYVLHHTSRLIRRQSPIQYELPQQLHDS